MNCSCFKAVVPKLETAAAGKIVPVCFGETADDPQLQLPGVVVASCQSAKCRTEHQVHGLLWQQTPEAAGSDDPGSCSSVSLAECKVLPTPGTNQEGTRSGPRARVWSPLF